MFSVVSLPSALVLLSISLGLSVNSWIELSRGQASQQNQSVNLARYVGWYEIERGQFALVTWGISRPLLVLDFDRAKFEALAADGPDSFRWKHGSDAESRIVRFVSDDHGVVTGLRWESPDGSSGYARKDSSYGYNQEEVRFNNGDVTLAGLLVTLREKGPHRAVVFIHGSGNSDRENVWAFHIADYLARRGVVVLLPDKRGSGRSGGDWRKAGFSVLAADALAAVKLLKSRREVKEIGVVGLSQGGWVAPLAASLSADIRFAAVVSGAAVTVREQVAHELEQTFRQLKVAEADIEYSKGVLRLAERYARTGQGWDEYAAARAKTRFPVSTAFPFKQDDWHWEWNRKVMDFDPMPLWERLRIPVLMVYGDQDEKDNVPVKESVARLERMIRKTERRAFTVKVFEGSGHALGDPNTNWIRKDFLDLLAAWVKARHERLW